METERLYIRRFAEKDFAGFKALIKDKMSSEYSVYDEQFPTDDTGLQYLFDYFKGSDEFFAIVLKSAGAPIGYIALNAVDGETRNLGFCLHRDYMGKGYAAEAAKAMISHCKDVLKLKRLVSGTADENAPSVRLLKRLGFTETERAPGSFVNDENGNPIRFTGCSYLLLL